MRCRHAHVEPNHRAIKGEAQGVVEGGEIGGKHERRYWHHEDHHELHGTDKGVLGTGPLICQTKDSTCTTACAVTREYAHVARIMKTNLTPKLTTTGTFDACLPIQCQSIQHLCNFTSGEKKWRNQNRTKATKEEAGLRESLNEVQRKNAKEDACAVGAWTHDRECTCCRCTRMMRCVCCRCICMDVRKGMHVL